jgi:hypothetical protein
VVWSLAAVWASTGVLGAAEGVGGAGVSVGVAVGVGASVGGEVGESVGATTALGVAGTVTLGVELPQAAATAK